MRTPLFAVTATAKTIKVVLFSIALLFTGYVSLSQHRTQLWGVADRGGPLNVGYIFKYDVAANTLSKESFLNKYVNSKTYHAGIFKADNNYLYSVRTQNDSIDRATIVRFNRNTNKAETVYTFDPNFYGLISATLTEFQGLYYGLSYGGQTDPYTTIPGIIFAYDPVTNTVTNKFSLNNTQHQFWYPWGELFLYNNKFYGVGSYGGNNNNGVLFEYDPVANTVVKKFDFTEAVTGRTPLGLLQLYNGKLYGMCLVGGASSNGTLFEYEIATGILKKIFDFPIKMQWSKPALVNDKLYWPGDAGRVVEYNITSKSSSVYTVYVTSTSPMIRAYNSSPFTVYNGELYGICAASDLSIDLDSGFVYKWTPGAVYGQKLATIYAGKEGHYTPGAPLILDNKIYGLTDYGSNYGRGSMFEVDPAAGTSTIKAVFGTGIQGYSENDLSSNLLYLNNRFYGTTEKGGLHDYGFLYSYNPATKETDRIHDFKQLEPNLPYGNLHAWSVNDNQFFGLTWQGISQQFNPWQYHYHITDKKFTYSAEQNDYSWLHYYHGTPQPYLAYSYRTYVARPANGAEKAGIFMTYPGAPNQVPTWTREFTFPSNLTIEQEKGMITLESDNEIFGMASSVVNGLKRDVVYKWNALTNDFSYNVLPSNIKKQLGLTGVPVKFNNKVYFFTIMGCNGYGSLIEWDNATGTVAEYCLENQYTDGLVMGSLTVADGKLYALGSKSIVCFDPVAKTFKMAYKPAVPFMSDFVYTYLTNNKKLTLVTSNEPPVFSSIDSINICLDDSLSRTITFDISDADQDVLTLKPTIDSSFIESCSIKPETVNGKLQYTMKLKTFNKTGRTVIDISATDGYGGIITQSVAVNTSRRTMASLVFAIDTLCKKDTSIALNGGSPKGGIYQVDNVTVDTLKAGSLNVGPHTLKYVYTSPGGCKDSLSVSFYIVNCPDGVNPIAPPPAFTPYPNPSSGIVRLENSEQLLTTVKVFNAQGFVVYTKASADKIIVLDLSALETGIYYISVTNSKGSVSGKVSIVK